MASRFDDDKIVFGTGKKWDIQLAQGERTQRMFAEILQTKKIELIEVKKEDWIWEKTGNLAIEYWDRGKPSGIAVTDADYWVHVLERKGEPLCWFMFPVERLRDLVREAWHRGEYREGCGDGGSKLALIRLIDLLR